MNFAYPTYKYLSTCFFVLLFPIFWIYSCITGRHRKDLSQRLGLYPDNIVSAISGSPRVWMHAASVGEISVALPIIESLTTLMPNCAIILSTTTESGRAFAQNMLQKGQSRSKATCLYAPVDFIVSVRKALATLKPDILVCLETEIWPNWLVSAHKMGIKTAFVNGRISVHSIKGYLRIRPLMKEILQCVDGFSMIRAADAQRLMMIGAPRDQIEINGNAKYDLLLRQADANLQTSMEGIYNVNGDDPVFVAGSTRGAEGKIILDVYQRILQILPETLLIIAPRHVERVQHLKELVQERRFSCQLRTELSDKECLRTASVVIIDTIGELQAIYSIASIVFCGGSLVSLGGQNILEAAVWGKPVLYGPSMEDFLDAKELLDKTGGGIQVKDGRDLAEKAIYYLTHPHEAESVGKAAKKAVMSNKGAADKHAAVIHQLLHR